MSLIDIANTLVFLLGCYVVFKGVKILLKKQDFFFTKISGQIITIFIIENLLDEVSTLLFSTHVFFNTVIGSDGSPSSMNPWVAIILRVLIFGGSHFAMSHSHKLSKQDLKETQSLQCKVEEMLGTIEDLKKKLQEKTLV